MKNIIILMISLSLTSCAFPQKKQTNSQFSENYEEGEPGLVLVRTAGDSITRCHRYSVFGVGKCEEKKCLAYLKNALNQNSTEKIEEKEGRSTLIGTSVVICQNYKNEGGSLTKLESFQKVDGDLINGK